MDRTQRIASPRLVFALLLTAAASSLGQSGAWTRVADMPTPRFGLSTCVVEGKIYAFGGMTDANLSSFAPAVEMYDPATDSWTQMADMPTPRAFLGTSVVDGVIYAMGGRVNDPGGENDAGYYWGRPVAVVESFDPTTGHWTRMTDMPSPRADFAASAVGGRIYAFGGIAGGMHGDNFTVVEYDPAADHWTIQIEPTQGDVNWAHNIREGFATSVIDGGIYLVGGIDHHHQPPASIFEPEAGTWSEATRAPSARWTLSASVVDGRIYAVGGQVRGDRPYGPVGGDPVATAEAYDPATRSWVRLADLPAPTAALAVSAVDGTIYAIGGQTTEGGSGVASVYAFTPGAWPTTVQELGWGMVKALNRR